MYKRWSSRNSQKTKENRRRKKRYDEWSFWSILGDVVEEHFRGKALMFKNEKDSFFDDTLDTNDSELSFFDKKEDGYIREKKWNEQQIKEGEKDSLNYGDLDLRISNLEQDVEILEKDHRKFKYNVDDEFEYTHKRNNKKFTKIEEDLEDLHKKNR